MTTTTVRDARRLEVHGTVQGVGFRPFVYRLARRLGIDGTVRNAGGHVVIEAAGSPSAIAALARSVRDEAPPRAHVTRVAVAPLDEGALPVGSGFAVVASSESLRTARDFPPDIATCDECVAELFDPENRRYRYPFINCTNCGPRATIIDDLPYDRTRTAMRSFRLCPRCAAEYGDPSDRRFHAEPVACPECGPRLAWRLGAEPGRQPLAHGASALLAAEAAIGAGRIVALKGLGGYQLVCDATQASVVRRLRERKHRWTKPFAVMVRDLDAARGVARLTATESALLVSPARPIVLTEARIHAEPLLAPGVHPGSRQVGLFLPYTPVHHLLLNDLDRPLVVTSGNRSDEPIVIDDDLALVRLGDIADGFLQHDRGIRARYDDSVTRAVGRRPSVIRRARGYAPEPLPLPVRAPRPVLAAGAELKHTFTVAMGRRALVGPHTGDLEDADTFTAFRDNLDHLCRLQALSPEVVAHDLHPAYLSTQWALREWPTERRLAVQHHHAHVASCAAEHGVTGPFVGVAYDGLGLGDDGTLWGGEVLVADLTSYRRFARFATAPLPGGAAAVRRPARMMLGYLYGAEDLGGAGVDADALEAFVSRLPPREVEVVRRMVQGRLNSPVASSAGRLFDAASSLLGLRDDASYEGEPAMALEAACEPEEHGTLPWRVATHDDLLVYDPRPTLSALARGVADGEPVGRLAARFHDTVAAVTVELVSNAVRATGLDTVCISGGVFQNRRLTTSVMRTLKADGLRVLLNRRVPVNDGGISYGQAAVAAALLRAG